jgi:hypothetical protein
LPSGSFGFSLQKPPSRNNRWSLDLPEANPMTSGIVSIHHYVAKKRNPPQGKPAALAIKKDATQD